MGRWAYADTGWARTAALAPCVIGCAEEQDSTAQSILHTAVAEMVLSAQTVVRRCLLPDSFCLVLSGMPAPGCAAYVQAEVAGPSCLLTPEEAEAVAGKQG